MLIRQSRNAHRRIITAIAIFFGMAMFCSIGLQGQEDREQFVKANFIPGDIKVIEHSTITSGRLGEEETILRIEELVTKGAAQFEFIELGTTSKFYFNFKVGTKMFSFKFDSGQIFQVEQAVETQVYEGTFGPGQNLSIGFNNYLITIKHDDQVLTQTPFNGFATRIEASIIPIGGAPIIGKFMMTEQYVPPVIEANFLKKEIWVNEGSEANIELDLTSEYKEEGNASAVVQIVSDNIPHLSSFTNETVVFEETKSTFTIPVSAIGQAGTYALEITETSGNRVGIGSKKVLIVHVVVEEEDPSPIISGDLRIVSVDPNIGNETDLITITNLMPLESDRVFQVVRGIYNNEIRKWTRETGINQPVGLQQVTYIGNEPLPPNSVICAEIPASGDPELTSFQINGLPTSLFNVENINPVTNDYIHIEEAASGYFFLTDGRWIHNAQGSNLIGSVIDGHAINTTWELNANLTPPLSHVPADIECTVDETLSFPQIQNCKECCEEYSYNISCCDIQVISDCNESFEVRWEAKLENETSWFDLDVNLTTLYFQSLGEELLASNTSFRAIISYPGLTCADVVLSPYTYINPIEIEKNACNLSASVNIDPAIACDVSGLSFQWEFSKLGDAYIVLEETAGNIVAQAPGFYKVSTILNGGCIKSQEIEITDECLDCNLFDASLSTSNPSPCVGEEVLLTLNIVNNLPQDFVFVNWPEHPHLSDTNDPSVKRLKVTQNETFRVQVTNTYSCEDVYAEVSIDANQAFDVIISGVDKICGTSTLNTQEAPSLSVISSEPTSNQNNPNYTYLWSTGETSASIRINEELTPDPLNNQTINYQVTVTDEDGCEAYASHSITVVSKLETSIANFEGYCGGITFNIPGNNDQKFIEYSIDGGETYPFRYVVLATSRVKNERDIPPGEYYVTSRWSDGSCVTPLGWISLDDGNCCKYTLKKTDCTFGPTGYIKISVTSANYTDPNCLGGNLSTPDGNSYLLEPGRVKTIVVDVLDEGFGLYTFTSYEGIVKTLVVTKSDGDDCDLEPIYAICWSSDTCTVSHNYPLNCNLDPDCNEHYREKEVLELCKSRCQYGQTYTALCDNGNCIFNHVCSIHSENCFHASSPEEAIQMCVTACGGNPDPCEELPSCSLAENGDDCCCNGIPIVKPTCASGEILNDECECEAPAGPCAGLPFCDETASNAPCCCDGDRVYVSCPTNAPLDNNCDCNPACATDDGNATWDWPTGITWEVACSNGGPVLKGTTQGRFSLNCDICCDKAVGRIRAVVSIGGQTFTVDNKVLCSNNLNKIEIPLPCDKVIAGANISMSIDGIAHPQFINTFDCEIQPHASESFNYVLTSSDQVLLADCFDCQPCPNSPEEGDFWNEDISICEGESVLLSGPVCDCSYEWNDGIETHPRSVSPSADKNYALTVTNNITGCIEYDNVNVKVNDQPTATVTSGVIPCGENTTAEIEIITSFQFIEWTGPGGFSSTSKKVDVTVNGTYKAKVKRGDCIKYFDVRVEKDYCPPCDNVASNTPCLCAGALVSTPCPVNYILEECACTEDLCGNLNVELITSQSNNDICADNQYLFGMTFNHNDINMNDYTVSWYLNGDKLKSGTLARAENRILRLENPTIENDIYKVEVESLISNCVESDSKVVLSCDQICDSYIYQSGGSGVKSLNFQTPSVGTYLCFDFTPQSVPDKISISTSNRDILQTEFLSQDIAHPEDPYPCNTVFLGDTEFEIGDIGNISPNVNVEKVIFRSFNAIRCCFTINDNDDDITVVVDGTCRDDTFWELQPSCEEGLDKVAQITKTCNGEVETDNSESGTLIVKLKFWNARRITLENDFNNYEIVHSNENGVKNEFTFINVVSGEYKLKVEADFGSCESNIKIQ